MRRRPTEQSARPIARPWPRRLAVVGHVLHYRYKGHLYGYAPYVSEIERWAALFDTITIASPCVEGEPPGDTVRFRATNIRIAPQRETGGRAVAAKVRQFVAVPGILWSLARVLAKSDAILVRCPGNLGLLGILLAPLFSRCVVAKYAGQWTGYPEEAWTVRLQRALLRSWWWRGPVLVYGKRPDDPGHVVAFFSTALTDAQLARASDVARQRTPHAPLRILFVGRLSAAKNVDILLSSLAVLQQAAKEFTVVIVGDGPQRSALEAQVVRDGLPDRVRFDGAMSLEAVLDRYSNADVLVLASESEGWPKAIAEGMAFGLICIGSARGLIPSFLDEGRGIVVSPRDVDALSSALLRIATSPEAFRDVPRRASTWAAGYSLEAFERSLRELLSQRWQVQQPGSSPTEQPRPVHVLHIVDTLEPGGAERMAVNIVNSLPRARYASHLCTTRRDGLLDREVSSYVGRLRLGRTRRWDVAALVRLSAYARRHRIALIHAHGTSLFIGVLASFLPPFPAVIWHDHLGGRALHGRSSLGMRLAARRLRAVIVVTESLAGWARRYLGLPSQRINYLPNFVRPNDGPAGAVDLPGSAGARIVCVANIRPEKDHVTLLRAMAIVVRTVPEAHLLLVGSRMVAEQGALVDATIDEQGHGNSVTELGGRSDVARILRACDVGVLSSVSEGFPLALLEYGMAGLATVATRVGQCAELLDEGRAGRLVPPQAPERLAAALVELLRSPSLRRQLGGAFREHVEGSYGEREVLTRLCTLYDATLGARLTSPVGDPHHEPDLSTT